MNIIQDYRWKLVGVLFVTLFIGYLDRLNITFAIPLMAIEYGWNEQEIREKGSLLMSLFYVGYGISNIFFTPLAVRLGPRKSLMIIIVLWSLFTALGAYVSQFLMLFMATRVLLGLSEGVHFPMMNLLTKNWFPLHERARANGGWIAGIFCAVLIAPILYVPLMAEYGWRAGFIVLAIAGLVLSLPLVYWLVHDHPEQAPEGVVSESEHAFLTEHQQHEQQAGAVDGKLLHLMLKPSFLLVMAAGIFNNVVALGISSWLPTYFSTNKGIPFNEITWLVAGPYVFSLVGIVVWATIGDKINGRAKVAALGYLVCGVFLYLALNAESLFWIAFLFSGAVFFISSFNICEFAMVQRLLPKEKVAQGAGIYNGLSTMIGGGLGPVVVSPIIGDGGGTWIVSVVCLINAVVLLNLYRIVKY